MMPGDPQAMRYAEQLLETYPDMVGISSFTANAEEYSILWSDASGTVSYPILWDDLIPLERYVYTLYHPHGGHHTRDPAIISPTRRVPPKGTEEEPRWTVMSPDGKIYESCHQSYTAEGWGRRTTVYVHNNPEDTYDCAVTKDAYRDVQGRFEEADLLRRIHSDGNFPGVVRVLHSDPVTGQDGSPIATSHPAMIGATHRKKNRLVIGSRGSKLENAKSVKDILKAVFDGVEGTRYLSDLLIAVCHNSDFLLYSRSCPCEQEALSLPRH